MKLTELIEQVEWALPTGGAGDNVQALRALDLPALLACVKALRLSIRQRGHRKSDEIALDTLRESGIEVD